MRTCVVPSKLKVPPTFPPVRDAGCSGVCSGEEGAVMCAEQIARVRLAAPGGDQPRGKSARRLAINLARTVLFPSMVRVAGLLLASRFPFQPEKVWEAKGIAVSVTCSPSS